MASTEIENMDALAAVLADLPTWVTWTGLGTTLLRAARIGVPELTDTASLPAIVLDFGQGRRTNIGATANSASFRPAGQIAVVVFDVDDESDGTLAVRWRAFADKFFALIDDLITAAHDTVIINNLSYSDQPIHRDALNVWQAQDTNSDDIDDATEKAVWSAAFVVGWGGPPA